MRHSILFLSSLSIAAVSSLLLLACSAGDADTTPSNNQPATNPGKEDPQATPEKTEAPLTARPVCSTVETGPKFGEGCSGTGSGDVLCGLTDKTRCGDNACVYDSRTAGTFAFYCSAKCTVGDSSRCPAGYECVNPSASCSSGNENGLCAQRTGFGCDPSVKVSNSSGKFIEGPAGELYRLESQSINSSTSTSTKGLLSVRQGSAFKSVTSWDGDASIRAMVRNGDSLLLITSNTNILIKDGKATATKVAGQTSSGSYASAVYGVAKDGSFIMLSTTGGEAFAALSKRGDDGTWSEVGPTRQRLTSTITSLTKGFLAVCATGEKALCTSADGETFNPIVLPEGVSLIKKEGTTGGSSDVITPFSAAGGSIEDFHLAIGGKLYHHRKGVWVEEGPKANTPPPPPEGSPSPTSYARPDILRSFADGTIVFHTWDYATINGSYATYIYGDDCWSYSPAGKNLENTDLVKSANGNAFVFSNNQQLCTVATR